MVFEALPNGRFIYAGQVLLLSESGEKAIVQSDRAGRTRRVISLDWPPSGKKFVVVWPD